MFLLEKDKQNDENKRYITIKKLYKFQSIILEFANCQIKEEIRIHNGSTAL
jgi:hypothetical protein